MYMVEEGQIDIFVRDQSDSTSPLRTFAAGDVVGEFALLDGRARSATARARGDLKVLTLQRETFNKFIQSRPRVVLAMLQYLADKLRYTTDITKASTEAVHRIALGEYDRMKSDTKMAPAPAAELAMIEPHMLTVETAEGVFSSAAQRLQEREEALGAAS